MSALDELIKDFKKLQLHVLGFERYKIRRVYEHVQFEAKNVKLALYFVDAYTESGLLIKTKLGRIRNYELIGFIDNWIDEHCSIADEKFVDILIKEVANVV